MVQLHWQWYVMLTLLGLIAFDTVPADALMVLPDYNNIFIQVANNEGAKYDAFGNDTYNIRFEGIDRGLNALHISTDPLLNFGQVTVTNNQTGTFYATDSGGKGYEDEIILLIAVNGTIPDNFSLRIKTDGYTWTPNLIRNQAPSLETIIYQPVALDESFIKESFSCGPQIWKPTGNEADYPLYADQDLNDHNNLFYLMFVDLNSGVLRPNTSLVNSGAVRINYSFSNLESYAAFNVYGYCKTSNNGDDMIAWTNALVAPKAVSGYSVIGQPSTVTPLPGQTSAPTDPDHDGLYEDLSGNGAAGFSDVVLFFKNIEWISEPENEPESAFDFSGNGGIGFQDVVLLFKEV